MADRAERIDTELLRAICRELIAEKDSARLEKLLSLLCALVQSDQEEVELKLAELSERYPSLKRTRKTDQKKDGKDTGKGPGNREGI